MNTTPPEQWTKHERIVYLLDHWDIIHDPNGTSPHGMMSDGSGVPLLPLMARHQSVLELARCLELLYHAAPGDYRHLKTFHCGLETRTVTRMIPRRRPNTKKLELVETRLAEKIIPGWLNQQRVTRAQHFLETHFKGDVYIPMELWRALTQPIAA